jgi:cell division protein FtsB
VQPLEQQSIIEQGRRPGSGQRTLLWAILCVCLALLVAILGEAWTRAHAEAQVQAASARNAALRHDITATQHAITLAESPAEIERAARRWGYIRRGDQPVLVVITNGDSGLP